MIGDDIRLARELHRLVAAHPRLEAWTLGLSITTFRYVPEDLAPGTEAVDGYLNALNEELLHRLKVSGEVFVSNAVVRGTFLLRACIVNFRTTLAHLEALPAIVVRHGEEADHALRPAHLARGPLTGRNASVQDLTPAASSKNFAKATMPPPAWPQS